MVKCVSPDFIEIGSGEVEVRVSLNGDSYTTTYQKYNFFAVTDAEKCICFGPGIISGGAPQVETVFVIQAVDATGAFRETGGDEFDIVVRSSTTAATVPVEVTDQEDGKYLVTFTLPDADSEYEISVVFKGTFGGKAGHLRGSPFVVQADNDAGRDKNSMTGPLVMDSIRKEVAELAKFARQTENGLKAKVPEDNLNALLKMKEHIHNATARKGEIDLSFDRSRAVIVYLQGEGASMGRMLDSLQNARNAWQGLQKQVPVTRAAIAPQVKVQAAKTKVDIGEYEQNIAAYQEAFRALEFWQYSAGPEGARRLIDECEDLHKKKQEETDAKQHLANMFECSILMEGSQAMMSKIRQQIEWARDMWDAFDVYLTYQEECSSTLWAEADADAMEEETRSLMKAIKGVKKDIKWCDAFKQGE
jgi:dynein heavy chain, axonemal